MAFVTNIYFVLNQIQAFGYTKLVTLAKKAVFLRNHIAIVKDGFPAKPVVVNINTVVGGGEKSKVSHGWYRLFANVFVSIADANI
jgi:hypothetical protein